MIRVNHSITTTVRWGIIGCGDVVVRKSGPAFNSPPSSKLVGVMRRSPDLAENFAKQYDIPSWCTNADDLIYRSDIDAIYIATPPDKHLEYGLKVCKAGKPCLIEKPGGRSSKEWALLTEAFQKADIPLFISFYRRFLPKYLKIKEILESGVLGSLTSIQYQFIGSEINSNWRIDPVKSGGGLFWDIGCHILDLFDFWFGPLDLIGGAAGNFIDSYAAEDVVSCCFRTKDGIIGTALWNFTSKLYDEQLDIYGSAGKLSLPSCLNPSSPCILEIFPQEFHDKQRSNSTSNIKFFSALKKRFHLSKHTGEAENRFEYSFSPTPYVHSPLIASIVESIQKNIGNNTANLTTPESALRTLNFMDNILSDYYNGRADAYWCRPSTWQNKQNSLVLSNYEKIVPSIQNLNYRFSKSEILCFLETGYLGPFLCESPSLNKFSEKFYNNDGYQGKTLNLHLEDQQIMDVCSHPSIVCRVAQLLGSEEVKLFKTRFHIKMPQSKNLAPWHQDVGDRNGGYRSDGSPVPTLTVWLSVDGAKAANGTLAVLPGSHRRFYGNWKANFSANLESDPTFMTDIKRSEIHKFNAEPGEFYIMNSWLLHHSGINSSDSSRIALNMRFMSKDNQDEPGFESVSLLAY
ncbi:MAG: Gfo/Idh/MocA family oxidoreductase [Gloeobacterales cyanobacterium]